MSLPAQKALSPVPVSTSASTSLRALTSCTWAVSACAIFGVTVLSFSGRLSVIVAMRSFNSNMTVLDMAGFLASVRMDQAGAPAWWWRWCKSCNVASTLVALARSASA